MWGRASHVAADQAVTQASAPAAIAETHSATVVLIGDRAYKVKKPVDLGFLDFTTLERRRAACEREVALNRRLAPDVYLGVADVVGPDGAVCDHMVVMRRLPDQRRMSTLVAAGEVPWDCLREVARQIAALHADAPTAASDPAIGAAATRDAVAANWADNLAVIRSHTPDVLDGDTVARVAHLSSAYLAGREPLFTARIEDGFARDGHGDLLAEDIFCLDDGPRIIDCLDFDDRYRHGDVLLDVAFLAMDLRRLGDAAAADRFMRWYAELSGEQHPATLGCHYVAYRAGVRAKVACLRHEQGDPAAAGQARQLLAVCLEALRRGRVWLALVGGLPGTGKSTLADALADVTGAVVLRTDEIRKELAGLDREADARAPVGEGLYTPEQVAATYDHLLLRARRLLAAGVPVVADATWADAGHRRKAAALAQRTSSDLVQLRCEVPDDVAVARLAGRTPGRSTSDATAEVRAWMTRRTEAAGGWPAATTVPTDGGVAEALAAALVGMADALDTADEQVVAGARP